MYPVNQYMDPYFSQYRNHTPYPYYPPYGWEAGQPRPLTVDSPYWPPGYGPWPQNGGMHHMRPSEFHCRCNHTYAPVCYSFRPPFPQELPPPHLYYHGPLPPHPSTCASYFVPRHTYPVDQTPYGHDNFKSHCCECPNHVCQGAEKSKVKIEEERPDAKPMTEQKDANSANIICHPNNQYPFIWLPSGNMEGKENGSCYELPPQLLNGWVPGSDKRAGDVKQQEHDNEKRFQWPIVWMPARYDEPKQKAKELTEMHESPKSSEQEPPSPKIKIIPLSWFENGHDQKRSAKDSSGDHNDISVVKSQPTTVEHRDGMLVEGNHKSTPVVPKRLNHERKPARENYKTIPVVPEKEVDEKKAGTYRTIPVMTQKESDEKKTVVGEKKEVKKTSNAEKEGENIKTGEKEGENGKTNHGESSTAKHPKLTPVCLRVDPLPRKKSGNGNGTSRSPSPPNRKDVDKAKKDVKEVQSQNLEPKLLDTKKLITVPKVKEKSPDEMEKGMGFSNEMMPAASAKHSVEKEVPTSNYDQKVQASSASLDAQGNECAKNVEGGGTRENGGVESLKGGSKSTDGDEIIIQSEAKDDAKTYRTNLSEADAAVHIQSTYRGYDVRRWQPLDKLRKIRDVHEQMQSVRKQLQSLEDSSKKPTEKEQVAIGETIMNLLLKLDTIQGLHPSVREARKSVARELICLQEKLDTLCKLKSDESNLTTSKREKSERAESIGTAGLTSIAEASEEEEKATRLHEAQEPSSADSMEMHDVPSAISMDLRQDADSTEQNHQLEEASTTRIEETPDEVKPAAQVECQGASTDTKQVEKLNVILKEEGTEEEKAVKPLVELMEPLHDAASSEDSSGLKQCTASTVRNLHIEESNTGVSTTDAEDTATISMESGIKTEKDGAIGSQVQEALGAESLEQNHDVPHDALENSSVSLDDAESHEHDVTPANDYVMSNLDDQPKEARDINMPELVADTTQDSTKEADGTPEASMDDVGLAASADAEKPNQTVLLERPIESDSAPEQTVKGKSDDAVQYEVSAKDQTNDPIDTITSGSASGVTRAETVFPELDSCELSCVHEGALTGYERDEVNVTLESQTDAPKENICLDSSPVNVQASETDEASVGAVGANSAEEIGVRVSQIEECNSPVCATRVTSAEEVADNPKEDIGVQTENKASEEAFLASTTPDNLKDSDNKKLAEENQAFPSSATPDDLKDSDNKKLAEENQKLKEMLQKLLASGNDQMGVITDLSEKIKTLESKLARKKKPKVRVHRPTRHAMAKVL